VRAKIAPAQVIMRLRIMVRASLLFPIRDFISISAKIQRLASGIVVDIGTRLENELSRLGGCCWGNYQWYLVGFSFDIGQWSAGTCCSDRRLVQTARAESVRAACVPRACPSPRAHVGGATRAFLVLNECAGDLAHHDARGIGGVAQVVAVAVSRRCPP
jgi:hypothetical protein